MAITAASSATPSGFSSRKELLDSAAFKLEYAISLPSLKVGERHRVIVGKAVWKIFRAAVVSNEFHGILDGTQAAMVQDVDGGTVEFPATGRLPLLTESTKRLVAIRRIVPPIFCAGIFDNLLTAIADEQDPGRCEHLFRIKAWFKDQPPAKRIHRSKTEEMGHQRAGELPR